MILTVLRQAAAGAILIACASPTFAHEGVLHEGCPAGQSFATGSITVTGAFTRATPPSAQSAGGYMTIANTGSTDDTLLGATSEAAKTIGVHQMQMKGDVMEMGEVEGGLAIPAGGTAQLMPKGYHLMMVGLDQPFHQGECVAVTLHFANAGDLTVTLTVGGFAQQTPPGDDAMSQGMGDMSHDMSDMSGMSMN